MVFATNKIFRGTPKLLSFNLFSIFQVEENLKGYKQLFWKIFWKV